MNTTAPAAIDLLPFVDSTEFIGNPAALRERAGNDGYLFFRGLLPETAVTEVRDDLYRALEIEGTLDPSSPGLVAHSHLDAIPAADMRLDIGVSWPAYVDIQRVESMHALPHHPRFIELYEQLFGEEVFVHPRHIVRAMSGHPASRPTPAHQDFPLVQGSSETWTAWFPLEETPVERGPLIVLRSSHTRGYLPIAPAEGAGGLEALLCDDEPEWMGGAFAKGDVLTFPSFTVHRSVAATSRERIRLSMDIRFQPGSQPIEQKSLTNHSEAPWEEIYEGWHDETLQYYWMAEIPRISPWDDSLIQPGQRIC